MQLVRELFKKIAFKINKYLSKLFGRDLVARKKFRSEFILFSNGNNERFKLRWEQRMPILADNTDTTSFDRHYIYHTAWAARKLNELNIKKHVDISSILYFSSIISAFIKFEFYDYRPANLILSNLK